MKKIGIFILMLVLAMSFSVTALAADDDYLTRGRFCTLITENLQLNVDDIPEESPFSDVSVTDENYVGIMACYKAGIMASYGADQFKPQYQLFRASVATILYRAGMGLAPGVEPTITVPDDISDDTSYYNAVCSVLATGAMRVRQDGKFYPDQTAKESDIDWSVPLESYVIDKGSETLRFDLAEGSIRIYENIHGKLRYQQGDGDIIASTGSVIVQQSNNGTATENTITVESGKAELTISGLNVSTSEYPIEIQESASLDLTILGQNSLKIIKNSSKDYGIYFDTGASLTIQGSGTVLATGFGSSCNKTKLFINSGTVISDSDYGGLYAEYIEINGGTISAQGGDYCAGIGTGMIGGQIKGTIVINGGSVSATGGRFAAGIGGGHSTSFEKIIVNGGSVVATGGYHAPGIGNGAGSSGSQIGSGGDVLLNGGTIEATGYYCAIGGGDLDNKYGCDSIIISNTAIIDLRYSQYSGIKCLEKIIIDKQPAGCSALDHDAVFSVDAKGISGITYQWQISNDGVTWNDIASRTNSLAQIPISTGEDGSLIRCKITNGWGNVVYTDSAVLNLLAFALHPADTQILTGEMLILSCQSFSTNIVYQWQKSIDNGNTWRDIDGEIFADLILNGTLSDSGLYRCVITATNGDQLASNTATVTITEPNAPVTYKTVYYLQNADGKTYTAYEQKVSNGVAGTTVTAPEMTYAYYTENTEKGIISGTVAADGSLVLSRYYDRNSYTISFDMNGGSTETPITALHGAVVTVPSNPTRLGYIFDGWYSDAELKTPYIFTVMPTENITVYAKWSVAGADRGIEYQIVGIQLRDTSYQPISKAPKDTFYAEVRVKNLSSETMDTLVLASYDVDGKMLDMKFLYANPMVGQTFTFGTSMDNSAGNIAVIKAFMLPMLGGLVPLAESVEYHC